MEQKEMAKKRLIIYVLTAYGLTYLMGILMWYGSTKGYDLTAFPTAQMMYPATGVIIGLFLAHRFCRQVFLLRFWQQLES